MKKLALAIIVFGLTSPLWAENKSGDLGLGVVVGDITGPTFKYFIGPGTALDLGFGFESEFEAYGDIIWHGWNMFPKPNVGKFAGYLGFGPRYKERDHGDDSFGIRAVGGVDYWMEPYPIELFFELGPWFIFEPDTDTEMDLGLGLRYYFKGHR